jgi:hypothetical protein
MLDPLAQALAYLPRSSDHGLVHIAQPGERCSYGFTDSIATYFCTHYAEVVEHGQVRHLPGYLASAALPLVGIRAMQQRRTSKPRP